MVKARHEEACTKAREPLQEANPQAAEWFDDRKNQFATCFFLRNGVNGFGKVTSDPTENTMTVVMVQLVERMLASAHKQTELDTEWGSEGKELASHALSMLLVELQIAK